MNRARQTTSGSIAVGSIPLAEKLLSTTKLDNVRSIRRPTVETYAKDMLAGNWQVTGETIAIDQDGNLLDGFHRLNAVVKAGQTNPNIKVLLAFVEGVHTSSVLVMDSGRKRSIAQTLAKGGNVENAGAVVAGIKAWSKWFGTEAGRELTNTEIRAILDADRDTWDAAADAAVEVYKEGVRAIGKGMLVAFAFQALKVQTRKADEKEILEMLRDVALGEDLDKQDPAFILRNWLIKRHAAGRKLSTGEQAYALTHYFNTWAVGKTWKPRIPKDYPSGLVTAAQDLPHLVVISKGE
jgi:hypothetical protein